MLSSSETYTESFGALVQCEDMWECDVQSTNAADFTVFVGDLAPDVTDYALQENFRHFFASVRSAKVSISIHMLRLH